VLSVGIFYSVINILLHPCVCIRGGRMGGDYRSGRSGGPPPMRNRRDDYDDRRRSGGGGYGRGGG